MTKRYQRTAISQYLILGLILGGIIGLGVLFRYIMAEFSFVDYFAIPWAAGRSWLLESRNPYDSATIVLARQTLSTSEYQATLPDQNILINPIINLIFYLPFSLIPYEISRMIWTVVLIVCSGMIVYTALKLSGWKLSPIAKIGVILLSLLWFPGIYSVITGQLFTIIVFLILASIALINDGQDTTAGFLLSLIFGSLPTTLLILIFLFVWSISNQRWSILIAYISGLAFLVIITWLMLPSWPIDWLRGIFQNYNNLAWIETPIISLVSLLPGIENFLSIFFHAVLVIYFLALCITSWKKTGMVFTWKTIILLVVSFLLHTQSSISLLSLVLPAMFIVSRFWSERWGLAGKLISGSLLLIIAIGSWFLVFPEVQSFEEISAPLLSVGLPVLVFMGMLWTRWWALDIPKLPDEYR